MTLRSRPILQFAIPLFSSVLHQHFQIREIFPPAFFPVGCRFLEVRLPMDHFRLLITVTSGSRNISDVIRIHIRPPKSQLMYKTTSSLPGGAYKSPEKILSPSSYNFYRRRGFCSISTLTEIKQPRSLPVFLLTPNSRNPISFPLSARPPANFASISEIILNNHYTHFGWTFPFH